MGNISNIETGQNDWRKDYHYGLYNHRLVTTDSEVYTRPFIVIRNRYGVIVHFTTLHNYAGIFENKVFVPVTSDAEAKLHYICMMLNYVFIEHYTEFHIDHIFNISRAALESFFRDYATAPLPGGTFRGEQSVEKCVHAVTAFFRKLRRRFGDHVLLSEIDLVSHRCTSHRCTMYT